MRRRMMVAEKGADLVLADAPEGLDTCPTDCSLHDCQARALLVGPRAAAGAARRAAAGDRRRRRHRLGLHRAARRAADRARRPPHRWCSTPRTRAWAAARATAGRSRPASSRRTTCSRGATATQRAFDILQGRPALARLDRRLRRRARGSTATSRVVGRFHAAHNAAQFEALARAGRAAAARAWKSRRTWCRAPSSAASSAPTPTGAAWSTQQHCSVRSGALPPGPARARARRRRAGRRALPGDAHRARRRSGFASCTAARHDARARRRRRHQRLHRRADAVAAAPRHSRSAATSSPPSRCRAALMARLMPEGPHRQRHAQGRLLLPRVARPHAHPLRRPRVAHETDPRVSGPLLHADMVGALPGARATCASATRGAASSPTPSTS